MNEQALRQRLMLIAKSRRESFNETWHTFVLERFLARIAKSEHRERFIFKGGFLLGRYLNLGRETRDLDFLVQQLGSARLGIEAALTAIAAVDLADGVFFSLVSIDDLRHPHMKFPGYDVKLAANAGRMRENVSIDIGVGDAAHPVEKEIDLLKSPGKDFFENSISLLAYTPETIFAEKLQTAVMRQESNSRMKDYYDLWMLCGSGLVDSDELQRSLQATFENRSTALASLPLTFSANQVAQLQRYWTPFCRNLSVKATTPPHHISEVLADINRFLSALGIDAP